MELFGISWQAWYTIIVVVTMFLVLIFTKLRTDIAFLGTIVALYAGGILNVQESFGGFASNSVLVVGAMYCVIAGLTYTGVLNWIVKHLMGAPKRLWGATVRVMLPVAFLSSVLSNTTVVALFVNVVKLWSKKLGIAPSKLLIPLSYASGMGGICTLIGTPPNLIISGMYAHDTGIQMGIFTPLACGLFCLAVGVLSMIAMQKLIPERKSPMDTISENDFTTELTVPSDNINIGLTLSEAYGTVNMDDPKVGVVSIRRFDREMVYPVADDEFIMGGDRILVSGSTSAIKTFSRKLGLKNETLDAVIESEEISEEHNWKTGVSSLILITSILLAAFNVLPLLESCLLAAAAMMVFRCCTPTQSFQSINWSILVVFAGSIAIGNAIEKTGLAQMLAENILSVCGTNPYVVLTAICLVGTFITEFISNTAAGAMFYPIAMSAATSLGVNPVTFCVGLMISVSSSFATPIGSPTHMLVYMPGGYKFSDFARTGILMNFIILAANIIITPIIFPF